MMIEELSPKRLRDLLDYDEETGIFTWRVTRGRLARKFDVAWSCHCDGYKEIKIDGRSYLAHRLAWMYVHGVWPKDGIDHINGVRNDNRLVNLREATKAQNAQNRRKAIRGSTSGYLGVSFVRKGRKWRARITLDGNIRLLGSFNCPTAAYLLGYLPAKRHLHEFSSN